MEAILIASDPDLYLLMGKIKISEGMKRLQDLVQWYKDNLIPERTGRVNEIMAYLQSLQRQIQVIESLAKHGEVDVYVNVNGTDLQHGQEIESLAQHGEIPIYSNVNRIDLQRGQEIECLAQQGEVLVYSNINGTDLQRGQEIESLAQQGEVPVYSNANGTDLQHGQEITQIREQNAYFGHILNQENEMVMDPNIENTSSAKRRKLKSKVWEDFKKYEDKNGKELAKCKHCKKDFVGSSKSGTTHLKNHLRSCQGLRNPGGVVDKEKEKSLIDPALNDSELVQKIIKCGLNAIKDDILDVYKQEKDKLHRYLHKLPSRFNVTIERQFGLWFLTTWFIDDNWELKRIISLLGRYEDEVVYEIVKSWLVDWNIDKKLCSMARGELFNVFENEEVIENINNWFNERGSLPFIGNFRSFSLLLDKFGHIISLGALDRISGNYILCKQSELLRYVRISSNVNKFQSAISNAQSMGKTVISESVPPFGCLIDDAFEWVMNSKEAFCELEHIDPDFKSINFTKEEWDDATLLYNSWKVLKDLRDDLWNSLEPKQTANVYFPMVYHIIFKLLQLGRSANLYYCQVASQFLSYFDQYWGNSNLILVIAIILDPRFKMNIVEHFYEEIYGNQVDTPFKKIIDGVRNIYNKYAEGTNNSKSSSPSYHVDSNSLGTPSKRVDIMGRSFAFSQHVNDIATPKSELDRYLRDSNCPSSEGFNLLEWWRVNSLTYPTLAKIARDFLSIPFYPMFDLDYSLSHEIDDIYDCCYLDDDLKQVFTCTKVWLNCPVIK